MKFIANFKPTEVVVCIEAPAFMANGKVVDLSMLVGGVYYGLLHKGYVVTLVPPSANKKFFTGNGKASKEDMINTLPKDVLEEFKGYKKKDDLADAYALAKYAEGLVNAN
jgi:Holliday junction resolvasome RuvABC endonuclease subunit